MRRSSTTRSFRKPIAAWTGTTREAHRRRSGRAGAGREDRAAPHMLPHGDRSGMVIEPWLTDQWYCDAVTLAQPAIKAVEEGKTVFRARSSGKHLFRMDAQHPALVHQPPDLVGPSDPGMVRAGRRGVRRGDRGCGKAAAEAHYGAPTALTRDSDVLDTIGALALPRPGWPGGPRSWSATIPVTCWSPASTSSSSGLPG